MKKIISAGLPSEYTVAKRRLGENFVTPSRPIRSLRTTAARDENCDSIDPVNYSLNVKSIVTNNTSLPAISQLTCKLRRCAKMFLYLSVIQHLGKFLKLGDVPLECASNWFPVGCQNIAPDIEGTKGQTGAIHQSRPEYARFCR